MSRSRATAMPKLQGRSLRVMITDKLRSDGAAKREIKPNVVRRSHRSLNNRAENSHQPVRGRERVMEAWRQIAHIHAA
jgi:putative transposase